MKLKMKKNKLLRVVFAFAVAISFNFFTSYCHAADEKAQAKAVVSSKSNNKYTVSIQNAKGFIARIEYSVPGRLGSRKSILFTLLLYYEKFCKYYLGYK